jgi:hypothetical protein
MVSGEGADEGPSSARRSSARWAGVSVDIRGMR